MAITGRTGEFNHRGETPGREVCNQVVPDTLRHLLVDPAVGNHLRVVFRVGDIHKNAGAPPGGVKVLSQKLLECPQVRAVPFETPRGKRHAESRPLNQEHAGGEDFLYIPCLNDDDDHIAALAGVIEQNLQGWLD